MTALAGLLTSIAWAAPARAGCVAVSTTPRRRGCPTPGELRSRIWSARPPRQDIRGVAREVRLSSSSSRAAPCCGCARGEEASAAGSPPEDVLPLGQALLATPLAASSDVGEHAGVAGAPDPVEPTPQQDSPLARRDAVQPTTARKRAHVGLEQAFAPLAPQWRRRCPRRRWRGPGAWIGPTVSAGVLMGRWLPSISLRQQSALSDGPSIDGTVVAIAVQSRFEISPFELRAGLVLRGAAVQRDSPHRRGEQGRLEGRISRGDLVRDSRVFRWGAAWCFRPTPT